MRTQIAAPWRHPMMLRPEKLTQRLPYLKQPTLCQTHLKGTFFASYSIVGEVSAQLMQPNDLIQLGMQADAAGRLEPQASDSTPVFNGIIQEVSGSS